MKAAICLLTLVSATAHRIPLTTKAGSVYNKYPSLIDTTINYDPFKPFSFINKLIWGKIESELEMALSLHQQRSKP